MWTGSLIGLGPREAGKLVLDPMLPTQLGTLMYIICGGRWVPWTKHRAHMRSPP